MVARRPEPRESGARSICTVGAVFRDRAGVTLIEILVASVVIGIGAIGLALMLGTGQAVLTAEGDNRGALYLAQQRIEQLRAQGFLTVATALLAPISYASYTGTETLDAQMQTPPVGAVLYTRTTSIECVSAADYATVLSDCTGSPTPPMRITVTVTTTPGGQLHQRTRPVTLRSVLSNR